MTAFAESVVEAAAHAVARYADSPRRQHPDAVLSGAKGRRAGEFCAFWTGDALRRMGEKRECSFADEVPAGSPHLRCGAGVREHRGASLGDPER